MRILEECVRCFISSLFMGIFLAKAHCRYIPLIQRFKIIVFSLIYTIVNAFFGTFLDSSLLIFFSFCIIFIFTNVVYHDNILLALCLTIVVFILQAVVYLGWAFVGAVIQIIVYCAGNSNGFGVSGHEKRTDCHTAENGFIWFPLTKNTQTQSLRDGFPETFLHCILHCIFDG